MYQPFVWLNCPRGCASIFAPFICPPSARLPPEYWKVGMAIMAARPGGWIPSPRLCFAFVLRLPSFGDAGEGVFFWLVGPALTGCAVETRIFLTVRSCGTKACSDGLGHLRRPLSTAVADRSNSGGRKPGRWFLCHSRSTPHHPFGPFRFNWACSAQRPPSALRVVSALWVRDGSGQSRRVRFQSPNNPWRRGGLGIGTSGGTTGSV